MDIGEVRLNRDQQIAILEGRHIGIDAALHADFRRPARHGVGDLRQDGVVGMVVGVGFPFLALEAAELAADEADIGEVDVAIDDVGDFFADVLGAREVGGLDHGAQIVAGRRINRQALVGREFLAVETLEQHRAHVGRRVSHQDVQRRRLDIVHKAANLIEIHDQTSAPTRSLSRSMAGLIAGSTHSSLMYSG